MEMSLLTACSDAGFCIITFNKNAASFPLTDCCQVYKGRHTTIQVFAMRDPISVLWSHRSQNHRMLGIGRNLYGSSSPTPLLKQGHLQQTAQDCIQAGLEYVRRRRLHKLPGQPVPVLRHHQREEVLPHVQTEFPLLQFVPIGPCPVAGHH